MATTYLMLPLFQTLFYSVLRELTHAILTSLSEVGCIKILI